MMDWQTFGVIAALAWGAVVLAFCTRWIFRAEAKSRREGLCLGEIPQAPSAKPIKDPPRLCVSARDKNTLVVLLFFAVIATVEAQKPTNNVPPNLNAPLPQMQSGAGSFQTGFTGLTGLEHLAGLQGLGNPVNLVNPVQLTNTDIARGYTLVEEDDDAAAIEIPTNAVTVGNWHLHGARSSIGNNRLDLAPWSFPLGTNHAAFSSFWYFVEGKLRPTPRDAAHEICAVGAPMLAMQGASCLWLAVGDDDSRTLVWDNFFLNGDTNAPVTAQIQLWPDGDFATQSNSLRRVYARINPDDWDGDGLDWQGLAAKPNGAPQC